MTTTDMKHTLYLLLLICCCLIFAGTASAQFSVSERTYKKLDKVEKLMEQKNFKEALTILQALESSSADRKYELTLVYQALGYLYYETSRQQQAIEYFEKSLDLNASPEPVLQNIRLNLIQLHAAANEYSTAIQQFETWIKKESSPSGDVLALGGSLYAYEKQYDTAIKYLKQAIASAKPAKESWYRTLLSIYYQREDYRSATTLLQQLIALYPENKDYWMQLFSGYYLLGDYQKALSTLELAYTKNLVTSEEQIINLARLYIFIGTPVRAVNLINREFTNNRLKKNDTNLQLLADAYLHSQEIEQSAQTYEELARLTNKPDNYLQAARLYMESREWTKVIDTLNSAGDKLDVGQAQLLKGMALVELKEFEKAIQSFREARQQADSRVSANQWIDYINTQQLIH